ncbi:transcription repressor OFP13-like [Malania oleifera]|uniref:transcription repressor OFP13-like n=1 Tax=Malania oleifera TaxID=397392 RepID=UPI0025ADEE0A|nr:transcription repressor OFP13-like [Malania oleifera]
MSKKKNHLPSLFKNKEGKTSSKWPHRSKKLKAISLQARERTFKKVNSVLSNAAKFIKKLNSSPRVSVVVESKQQEPSPRLPSSSMEMAFHALRSERLFFEKEETRSIMAAEAHSPFNMCEMVTLDSEDPYLDFRVSMEEVVEACGLKSHGQHREQLQELLAWYLRMNGRKNHGVIVWAFVDMFLGLPSPSSGCSFPDCHHHDYASASSSRLYCGWGVET